MNEDVMKLELEESSSGILFMMKKNVLESITPATTSKRQQLVAIIATVPFLVEHIKALSSGCLSIY